MILGLAHQLFRLFRENSDVVPLSRLKREGVRQVTVLDWERVEKLIARAVEEALARRGIGLSAEALRSVNQEALETFHRLLEERDSLKQVKSTLEREKEELARNLERLRAEYERSAAELVRERETPVTAASVPLAGAAAGALGDRLEAELDRILKEGGAATPAAVAALARRLVDEERARALEAARAEHKARVENLERRVAKLRRTLQQTEDVVERLKTARAEPEGVESIYREVQGLDASDARASEKRGLLDQVFQLNVELRDVIDGDGRTE